MDARSDLVLIAQVGAADDFGDFRSARLEHELQGAYLLVGDGDEAAGGLGFDVGGLKVLLRDGNLTVAPVQENFKTLESGDGQLHAGLRTLCGVHLLQDHADARLRVAQGSRRFSNGAIAFGKHRSRLVEDALALVERDPERRITL